MDLQELSDRQSADSVPPSDTGQERGVVQEDEQLLDSNTVSAESRGSHASHPQPSSSYYGSRKASIADGVSPSFRDPSSFASPLFLAPVIAPSVGPAPLEEDLYPCDNFQQVSQCVYRSGFPKKKNFPFLRKLRLKSIVTLILEEYPEQNLRFLQQEGIQLFQFGVPGNKEPFVDIPEATIASALSVVLDRRNHPLLIHCNKGKHRTGCLVGCLRKLQHWSFTSIFDEYRRMSTPKSRAMDQQFIELFDVSRVDFDRDHLPEYWPEFANYRPWT